MSQLGHVARRNMNYTKLRTEAIMNETDKNTFALGEQDFAINLMEHLVVPTFVLDADCRVMIWNRACERLTGVAASELIGTRNHWRAFYDEPRPLLADLLVQGRVHEAPGIYVQHGLGKELRNGITAENWCEMPRLQMRRYLAIDTGPIYDNAGKLIAVVQTLRDITIQKESQLALERLATRDGLTGLANRRCFDKTLDEEWRRTMREGQPISLLMVDADKFKRYNDTYGHIAGDECLRQIARAIEGEVRRAGEMAARFGGEEFAAILPNHSLSDATAVAERIRLAVQRICLPLEKAGGEEITVSIGVATSTGMDPADARALLAAADEALYAAKSAGRNQVVQAVMSMA